MHGRQTQNLTPLHIPQLLSHNPIQPAPNGFSILVYQHTRVVIESDHRSILALVLLLGPNDDGVPDVTTADFVGGGDGNGVGFGAEVALLLDYDYYSVACDGRICELYTLIGSF